MKSRAADCRILSMLPNKIAEQRWSEWSLCEPSRDGPCGVHVRSGSCRALSIREKHGKRKQCWSPKFFFFTPHSSMVFLIFCLCLRSIDDDIGTYPTSSSLSSSSPLMYFYPEMECRFFFLFHPKVEVTSLLLDVQPSRRNEKVTGVKVTFIFLFLFNFLLLYIFFISSQHQCTALRRVKFTF